MGFFKDRSNYIPSHAPRPGAAPGGDALSDYKVVGVWDADGAFTESEVIVVELERPDEFRRRAQRPGDLLRMTRQEAAVVGKHIALAPVFGAEAD